MLIYVIRRLLWAVVLFIAVTMVTYMIFYVIPANPARLACGQRATEECIANASSTGSGSTGPCRSSTGCS